MVREKSLSFPSKEATLEGVLALVEKESAPAPAVVVCHADPWMGGTMESPVVQAICRHLSEAGVATLRFNFRGVGESTGSYESGRGEREDARAAVRLLRAWPGIDKRRLGVAGYSFGATMAVLAGLREQRVRGVAAISPPLGLLESRELAGFGKPLLVVLGERDLMVPPSKLEAARPRLQPAAETAVIAGADRSWGGREAALGAEVARFFQRVLAKEQRGQG